MIIGNIWDEDTAGIVFSPAMERALEYLKKTDFSKLEDGRYEIEGDRIYATVSRYQSKPWNECRPEAHRRYADVQYMAEGQELIGWCAFTPASWRRCRVTPASRAKAAKNSAQSSVSKSPTFGAAMFSSG